MSEKMSNAQQALDKRRGQMNNRYRPGFHPSVPVGWMNDPNGFSMFKGKIHLFYQFFPYDSVWGSMHWGHWTSEDFTHWSDEPVAMAPDKEFDSEGCYSGTAIEVGRKLYLVYTGVRTEGPGGRRLQQQCIAESADGSHFTKWCDNPVIGYDKLPTDYSPYHFRDPKILQIPGGYRVITAVKGQKCGQLITFVSKDLHYWSYEGVFVNDLGEMPECPDFFHLDGHAVVITCIIRSDPLPFPNNYLVCYQVGTAVDGHFFSNNPRRTVDWGLDFYAPQTIEAADGRRILIGWALSWSHVQATHRLGHGWAGIMTMARECVIKEETLYQQPVREMAARRTEAQNLPQRLIQKETSLPECAGKKKELDLLLDVEHANSVTLQLMKTGNESLELTWLRESNRLRLDRRNCGYPLTDDGSPEKMPYSEAPVTIKDNRLHLRIFVDVAIVEVFVGDGEVAMSTLAYPKGDSYDVSLRADGFVQIISGIGWEIL